MKKALLCILAFLLTISAFAGAGADNDSQVMDILRQAGIAEPVQLLQWGGTAACFSETDGVKRLIVLEQRDGMWRIVIDNPTALLQDYDWPELCLDSDNAVFWTYTLSDREIVRYHSSRNADGTWNPVDQYFSDSGFGEYTHVWGTVWDDAHGGEIVRTFGMYDENDNDHGIELMEVLPASWMADCVRLADFDVSRFPTMFIAANDHFASENERFFREAASSLMPEYTFMKGMLKAGAMHYLMEKPDGSRVYVICEYMSHRAVNLIESSPLPAGTVLGWENFADSLRIDGRCVTVQLLYSGKAGLEYIYDDTAGEDAFLFFGDRTVWQDARMESVLYGGHPWNDITLIGWNSLPRTLYQASAQMDASNYAFVLNPDPGDRLHLREKPDRNSRSLGKYYNGTPVTVLSEQEDWAEVTVGGRHGWMMKEYLDIGLRYDGALWLNTLPMPQLYGRDNEPLKVYEEPRTGAYSYYTYAGQSGMKVIGIIGNEWYHVWFPASGEYGFVPQSDLTPGNG